MLDSLLKRIFRREVEKKVENAVTGVVHTALNSGQNQTVAPQAPAGQPMTTPVAAQVIENATSPEREWDIDYKHDIDYFRPILAKYFPEYTVEENVPFATVVPGQRVVYPPYTFVMRKNGAIALVISLQSKYGYKKGLHTYCGWKAGLKHINFFIEYPDHEDYVVNRIRENLAF